jgi:hypothetical protein
VRTTTAEMEGAQASPATPAPAARSTGEAPRPCRLPARAWAAFGTAAFVSGFLLDLFAGVNAADETWFLYVMHRITSGSALYRDVWYPAFPLAAWVGAVFTQLLGSEVLVLKAVTTLCFTATFLAVAVTARRFGAKPLHLALILAAMLGFAPPGYVGPGSLYSPLSFALLAATLAAVVTWLDSEDAEGRRAPFMLMLAACSAGLSFSAKQNIGVYAAVALAAVVILAEPRKPRRVAALLARAAGVFAATVGITLIPVVVSGNLPALLSDTLTTQGTYVRYAAIGYLAGLQSVYRYAMLSPSFWSVGGLLRIATYAAPLAALPLLVLAWARQRDVRYGAVFAFTLAAIAGIFPRADSGHVAAALPFVLLALTVAWCAPRARLAPALRTAGAALAVALVLARLAFAVAELPHRYATDPLVFGTAPHFVGAAFTSSELQGLEVSAEAVRTESGSGGVFIVSPRAGYLYLATGLEDPTRYDFPNTSALPTTAEDALVAELRSKPEEGVWFDPFLLRLAGLTPPRLYYYINHELLPGPVQPWGRMYYQPARKR